MKKAVVLTMSAIMLGSVVSQAAPTRVGEIRSKFEESIKTGQRSLDAANTVRFEQLKQELVRDLSAMTGGRVSTRDMNAALNKTLKFTEAGREVEIKLAKVAQAIKDARSATASINKNELDADAKRLFEQKERALEIMPKFLALASVMTKNATGSGQKEVDAFVKQMSLLQEGLMTMDAAELRSHLDVMEIAIENKLRNPELEGDQAYAQALKAKFGDKYATKLEEILGCARQ